MNRDDTINQVVLMLVRGVTSSTAETECVEKLKLDAADAHSIVAEAEQRIAVAANYNLAREVGTAYLRLNALYAQALKLDDPKTALASQRELNRLLRLYDLRPEKGLTGEPATDADRELAAVAAHLVPLGLVPDDHPLREHARVAAEAVRQHLAATAAARRS